ncbi:MAG: hypothetical protein JNM63_14805, partial [Spirochaetia bacterium]|nr:hypothetical protein [Spirochaetia bacterium]
MKLKSFVVKSGRTWIGFALAGCLLVGPAFSQPAETSEKKVEVTPKELPGAETFIYRDIKPEPVRLFVFKPKEWKKDDKRSALIYFFGGGWTRGTPDK